MFVLHSICVYSALAEDPAYGALITLLSFPCHFHVITHAIAFYQCVIVHICFKCIYSYSSGYCHDFILFERLGVCTYSTVCLLLCVIF